MDFNAKTNPGRESRLQQLEEDKVWDVLIIGGGATGAGIAVDAAARGFSTVLFDTQDFSEGTSSRSTKLIHGGVRYMKNPRDWKLVREAMIERKLLLGNAPHIVHPEPFILPCYENFEREYYMAGLCLYGAMAYGGYGGKSALAVGGFYAPNEKVMFSLGLGISEGGSKMGNFGVNFALDRSRDRKAEPRDIIYTRKEVDNSLAAQDEKIQLLLAKVEEQSREMEKQSREIEYLRAQVEK